MSARPKLSANQIALLKAAAVSRAETLVHLGEITALATDCIETAIELHPDFNEARTEAERDALHHHLLIHLRAIQHEAEILRKAGGS